MRPISIKRKRTQQGNSLVEFALFSFVLLDPVVRAACARQIP